MTDQPDPMACLTTYEVVSADAASAQITVRFENPYYSGAFISTKQRPVLDPETGQPTDEVEDYQADDDPNPHAVKTVTVPLTSAGLVDHPALVERLRDQSRGVRARMEAAHAEQVAAGLDALVGMTTPST